MGRQVNETQSLVRKQIFSASYESRPGEHERLEASTISEQRSARSTFDCIVLLAMPAAISETSPIFSNKIQGTLLTLTQKLTQQLTKCSMLTIKQLSE